MADKCTENRSNSLLIREQQHQKGTLCYFNRLANTKRFKIKCCPGDEEWNAHP